MIAARIFLLLCVIFWGWTFIATKIVLDYMTPVELLGLRFAIGLPVLFVVILTKRLKFDFNGKDKLNLLLGAGIITVHFLLQVVGLKYTSATNTGWIIAVTPLVMAVMAFLILREKIGYRAIIGIIVATVGILLLMSRGNMTNLDWLSSVGDWLILASAHTWALYTVAVRNITQRKNPLAVTFAILVPSAVLVLTYMTFTSDWNKFLDLPLEPTLALLFLGIFGMSVAHWFWQEGVSRIGAAKAGMFLYLEPVAVTVVAVPYLEETFGIYKAVGGIMVLAGVWISQRKRVKVARAKVN